MEPLSKIFESLKKNSDKTAIVKAKTESKKAELSSKQSTLKNDRLKRVTEALNAKKAENKALKTEEKKSEDKKIVKESSNLKKESSNLKILKRSISLSRKFESLKNRFDMKELKKNTRLEAILKRADKEDKEKVEGNEDRDEKRSWKKPENRRVQLSRTESSKRECGWRNSLERSRRESDEDSNERDEVIRREGRRCSNVTRRESFNNSAFLGRRTESIKRPEGRPDRQADERRSRLQREWEDNREERRCARLDSRSRRESSIEDIDRAERRFLNDLDADRYESNRRETLDRRSYRR